MTVTNKPNALGAFPRVRRFLHRPWTEKVQTIKNRLRSVASDIPVPIHLPLGFWWIKRNDNLAETLLSGSFENAELAFVDRFLKPGMTVLDIGAHQGLYSLIASRRVGSKGRVFSFEPSPRERRALRLNLAINFSRNVSIQPMALGSQESTVDLYVVQGWATGCNSLRPPDIHIPISPVRVRVTGLDQWLSQHHISQVDFIKLDVEGAELDVLRGAQSLLSHSAGPVILCELEDVRTAPWGHKAKDVADQLKEFGYELLRCDVSGELLRLPNNTEQYEGNFVAMRPEHMEHFKGTTEHGVRQIWHSPYETLRGRWGAVPTTATGITSTSHLVSLSDADLVAEWEGARKDITTGGEFAHRGWYHTLYADSMNGKKVMDVGSGFGVDPITFAQHGARVTFVDLVETNLKVLERLCKIMGLREVQFVHLKELDSLKPLDTDYDVIMAMGSLHHAPAEVLGPEIQELHRHLKVGGRWLQLAYPRARWVREGREPFNNWGTITDGSGTPWAEWYDLPKLLKLHEPAKFDVVLYQEFHNGDFNWFDLLYRGTPSPGS